MLPSFQKTIPSTSQSSVLESAEKPMSSQSQEILSILMDYSESTVPLSSCELTLDRVVNPMPLETVSL